MPVSLLNWMNIHQRGKQLDAVAPVVPPDRYQPPPLTPAGAALPATIPETQPEGVRIYHRNGQQVRWSLRDAGELWTKLRSVEIE